MHPIHFQHRFHFQLLTKMAGLFVGLLTLLPTPSLAMPGFARQYQISCIACHAAFPKLNDFGQDFVDNNYRLPNWKETTVSTGDDMLALPKIPPIAIRAQSYVQGREAYAVNVETGKKTEADADFQAPYLLKLISSAPLSDHISYYFYGIFAEKGANGETIIEDAWISHDDIFGSGIGMTLGQFQVSDLMFLRETRLTFQDYMAYRMARITYERGVIFDRDFGPVNLAIGLANGNGINDNVTVNSPGYQRPDHLFDNDNSKSTFGRLGVKLGSTSLGLFAYSGQQKNASGPAGTENGERDTDKNVRGLDISGKLGEKTTWYVQYLWNEWDSLIEKDKLYKWSGGFLGIDYIASPRWAFSMLYNYTDGREFDNTDTIYEGIDINSLTLNTAYYFMRNVKGVIEINADFLDTEEKTGTYYTGHLAKENYILLGFDAAF